MGTSSFVSELRRVASYAALCALASAGCKQDDLTLPQPPDVSGVLASYEMPDSSIGVGEAPEVAASTEDFLQLLDQLGLDAYVTEVLDALNKYVDDNDIPVEPRDPDVLIDAALVITRTCAGWGLPRPPIDPEANGQIRLNVNVEGSVLSRTLWGTATRCKQTITLSDADLDVSIDGALTIYMIDPPGTALASQSWLVIIDGTVTAGARSFTGTFDARVSPGLIEVRIPIGDKHLIAAIDAEGRVILRDASGVFTCDVAATTCTSERRSP